MLKTRSTSCMLVEEKEPVTIGVEIECYTILTSEKRISRSVLLPREKSSEDGERFTIDKSIGSEYVTKPFENIVGALYAIDRGLGKYADPFNNHNALPLPIGGWNDRFAGAHFHIGFKEKGFRKEEALSLANYIHDHIPFIIAVSANSPVWRRRITGYSSNRMLRVGREYCIPVVKGELNQNHYREMNFNPENKHKPSTLEIRVCDSNIPPYVCTVMTILRILASAWRNGEKACNSLTHEAYLQSRVEAARKGVKATLYWDGKPVTVGEYLRRLTQIYSDETSALDLPQEVLEVFSLLEKGWNHAEAIRHAAMESRRRLGRGWEKNMAVKLASAMEILLNGGSLKTYHRILGLESLPD
ncbi:MAG: glutamate-cysteine ligase family protein [Thermoproteota archaeon]